MQKKCKKSYKKLVKPLIHKVQTNLQSIKEPNCTELTSYHDMSNSNSPINIGSSDQTYPT